MNILFDNPNDSSLLTAHAINFEHVQSTRRITIYDLFMHEPHAHASVTKGLPS